MIVPRPLFLCPLRTGGADLYAHVVPPAGVGEFRWAVRGAGVELRGRAPTAGIGRGNVACVLPDGVDEATLSIEAGAERVSLVVGRYEQQTVLRLPLLGQALVVGSHRLGEVHRSAWEIPSQAFAWDFVPLTAELLALLRRPWAGGALPSASFAAFGCPVVAPADGTVVAVVDGAPDHADAGQLPNAESFASDPTLAAGNHLVVDHGDGLHSVLAHLLDASTTVVVGDRVCAGQQLAALGNSGFSSGPHLHFHCMDGPSLRDAAPLPVQLEVEGAQIDPQGGEIVGTD